MASRRASPNDASRQTLFQQRFEAKPTAYAPYGSQDEHPLRDAHTQLQARLQALRDVRGRLRFVASPSSGQIAMASPRDSMAIATRVALSTPSPTDDWVQRGGIAALDGLETLFFGFLTTHELVAAGAVCQSWYALARRDAFWEPLLQTPVEAYPLRAFLGFHAAASVPAIQVYIIYRKVRAQLQKLHAKDDESPRQSPDAVRFEELLVRFRRAGNNNHDDDDDDHRHHHEEMDEDVAMRDQRHAELPLVLPRLDAARRVPTATRDVREEHATNTRTTAVVPNLHLRSVHLVFPADEDLTAQDETHHVAEQDVVHVDDARPLPAAHVHEHHQQRQPRNPFFVPHNVDVEIDSDEEPADDVEMLAPDGTATDQPPPPPRPSQTSVLDACRRVRLHTWLAQRRVVSREVFRSFARQLLLALATLEASRIVHSDVCVGNILVLDRGATQISLPHASLSGVEDNQQAATGETQLPLFQLYCRNSVNIWATPGATTTAHTAAFDQTANGPPARGRLAEAQHTLRIRRRQQRLLAAVGIRAAEGEDDDHAMLRQLLLPRAALRADQHDDAAPPPALLAPIATHPQMPSSANYTNMVRAYIRILREVWTHGRVATTNERNLPFLSLMYLRPDVVKSVSMRSFIEYAEYLLSRSEATPAKLLNHVFLQDNRSGSPQSSKRRAASPAPFIVGRSALNPTSFANAEDYRTHAVAWYARYFASRQAEHLAPRGRSILSSFGALESRPSTLFGPAFFHDALSESRLPFQRFLSVAAPRTASSSWVHTLAVSQRFTLQKLDLSRVELPLSILLRELYHLQRLSHLRLPREILRDENMEQFVAALWCSGLLPTLEVMDDSVKKALDRMEFGYVTQLGIMASLLDHGSVKTPTPPTPALHHVFSSPF